MGICIAYKGKLRDPTLIPEFVGDLTARAEAVGWPSKTMTELVAEKLVNCTGLEGISLYPHRQCEPLHFHFDQEGTFVNHSYCTFLADNEMGKMMRQALAESIALTRQLTERSPKPAGRRGAAGAGGAGGGLYASIGVPGMPDNPGTSFFEQGKLYNWTKTQFAGAKVHTAVCAILRYVKQLYAPGLEITDDSGYFVDHDYEKLETQLAYVDYLVSVTSQAVETAATATTSAGAMTLEAFVERLNAELADAKNKLH